MRVAGAAVQVLVGAVQRVKDQGVAVRPGGKEGQDLGRAVAQLLALDGQVRAGLRRRQEQDLLAEPVHRADGRAGLVGGIGGLVLSGHLPLQAEGRLAALGQRRAHAQGERKQVSQHRGSPFVSVPAACRPRRCASSAQVGRGAW